MVCQPVAPSGSTSRSTPVCTSPFRSIARTRTRWSPGSTSTVAAHCTHVSRFGSADPAAPSTSPPSTATSTPVIPVCWAQATPPTWTAPAGTPSPDRGTSIRDGDLHRRLLGPAPLGPVRRDVRRTGSPRGPPATCRRTRTRRGPARSSGPGSRGRSAAADRSWRPRAWRPGRRSPRCSGVPQVQPSSDVWSTASAPGWTPASASRSSSRTPLHHALPIRSPPTGLDTQLSVTHASVRSLARSSA